MMMTTTFKNAAEAYAADYLYAVVNQDGRVVGYYKTKAGAERMASGSTYTVLKTDHME